MWLEGGKVELWQNCGKEAKGQCLRGSFQPPRPSGKANLMLQTISFAAIRNVHHEIPASEASFLISLWGRSTTLKAVMRNDLA
jgi:hypothetical protein